MTQSKANRSYSKWMQQLLDQSASFGVPTLVVPDDVYAATTSPFWAETDDAVEVNVQSNSTKQPTKTPLDFDLETPWHVLKNHSAPLRTSSPATSTTPPMIHSTSPNIIAISVEPHPIINLNYTILNQTAVPSTTISPTTTKPAPAKPLISGTNFNLETPWHVLKNQSLMAAAMASPTLVKNKTENISLDVTSPAVQTVETILWT